MKWTHDHVPDQTGKLVLVTGANSGIGFETALALANKGATAVMACRDLNKANRAAKLIRRNNPPGEVVVMALDLAALDSVRQFASEIRERYQQLHVLVNNAGVMVPPFGRTADGFELQFGINHLGHFALTGLLLDLILRTPRARIVTVTSVMHYAGRIAFDNLNAERSYNRMGAYAQSKLANLLFAYELQRRLEAEEKDTLSVSAHPGVTATQLQRHLPMGALLNRFFAQRPEMGVLSTLMAAADARVKGGEYFGPRGPMGVWGYPRRVASSRRSHDESVAAKLWTISEELSGVRFGALSPS